MYLLYLFAWKFIGILPEKTAYQLANLVADYINKRNGKGVKRLRSNYRRVLPEISESELATLTKSGMRSYLRYWFDTFRLNKWSKSRIIETTYVIRENLLRDPIDSKQGCIVALPHAGNWDHAGLYFCSQGIRVNTVAEHLRPERLFQRFIKHREAMGMRIFDIKARVTNNLIDVIKSGELVALPADRDLSASGIDVNFFGANARMPAGPALLAVRTGAPLITAYVGYRKSGIHIKFAGPFTSEVVGDERARIVDLTQQLADQFARDISADITSWHMMQRIFIAAAS